MSQAREPEDDWQWDDPFARQLEAPDNGDDCSTDLRSSTFDELIEGWRREGALPQWPDTPDAPHAPGAPSAPDAPEATATAPAGAETASSRPAKTDEPPAVGDAGVEAAAEGADPEDEHYVPPEPPPLPKLGAPAVVGIGLLGLGLLLLVAPWWIGVSETFAIPLGLLALASGLGWLVLRLWPAPPPTGDGDGEDDGAVI